jgi:hypothetical protein
MKMPDPIIEPITIAVAENNPIPCTNFGAEAVAGSVEEEVFVGITFPNLTANTNQSATRGV